MFDDFKRFSRLKALSERDVRELKRLITGDNQLSVGKITVDLNVVPSKSLSKDTVRHCIRKLSYEYAVKIKNSWLTAKRKRDRAKWYQEHQYWTVND